MSHTHTSVRGRKKSQLAQVLLQQYAENHYGAVSHVQHHHHHDAQNRYCPTEICHVPFLALFLASPTDLPADSNLNS